MKRRTKSFLLAALLVAAMIPLAFTPANYFEISKNLDIFATLFKELNTYYVDDIEPGSLMRDGIDAMLESLDPYTTYISEDDIEGYRMQTTGKYGGIGSLIRKRNDQDHVIVAEPYEGYPADKAGLMAGDRIIDIDGVDTKGKDTEEISKLLKGEPGTTVTVTVMRPMGDGTEQKITVDLIREEIKINNVPYYGMINDTIGYIRLSNFTEKAGKEVADALSDLKTNNDVRGLIFDLRGNPGGLLNEAVNVSNVFLPKGQEVVSTKGKVKEWDKIFKTLNSPVDEEIPLIVLTNGGSASASEIVSGSIQDLDRGVVVGQRTFGKGLVQTTRDLSYNTKLKVTTAKYYIPSGRCIQAIDYSHRDLNGDANKIPDSLKAPFKTLLYGRTVYDGAGIRPDLEVEQQEFSNIATTLTINNLIFDFATIYRAKHESLADPRDFQLTNAEFEEFVSFLSDKEYEYTTESEKLLEKLEESAKEEKYYDALANDFEDLKSNMKGDKKNDIYKHKNEIIEMLEQEIVGRYYYREGMVEATFDDDPDISAALDLFANPKQFSDILQGKQ